MTQIFLVNQNAAGSFPDPGNWNPANNSVEVVGSGGYGASAPTGSGCTQPPCRAYETPLRGELVWEHFDIASRSASQFVWNGDLPYTVEEQNWTPPTSRDYPTVGSVVGSGTGGGGGGYAKGINLSPTFPWPYYIQGSVSSGGGPYYYTIWGSGSPTTTQPPQTLGWVWAACGMGGLNGGTGASAGWPNGQTGGGGGLGASTAGVNGGGGGGAGGPHGAGTTGTSGVGGGAGGAADGGTVAGGAAGAAGNSGTQWDATHGVGSGSGGGSSTHFPGGAGANYGGGAGGGYGDINGGGISVAGGASIIVVTYTPVTSAGSAFIIV